MLSRYRGQMGERQLRKPSRELTQILADNIRAYRKAKDISQEELANICGLHRTYVGSVERGERNVTLSTVEVLAAVLGVSVPELLTKRGYLRMATDGNDPERYVEAIRKSGLSIYDPIEIGDPELWIPTPKLEHLFNAGMTGVSLAGQPLRTRSKVVKEHVCRALGYPVPSSFKKTQPRFPGQFFDTYVQKSNNLQIWNEELALTRRYVIIRVDEGNVITRVKVVTGHALALLDTTGTLTRKYQARLIVGEAKMELIADEDTELLRPFVRGGVDLAAVGSPLNDPRAAQLLPIREVFEQLRSLVGKAFPDTGYDQERGRGAVLHRLVCQHLGYADYQDDGQFPDIRHQLLEVKLQTSSTIDLGLVCPDSKEALDLSKIEDQQIRHCDVRYVLFYAVTDGQNVSLTHLFLATGEKFFTRFPQFRGKVLNRKLQIPLPVDFFDD